MKNSTRNMLCAAVIAPVAVLLAGAPALAATDGPTASLVKGVSAQTPVASTADPVVKVGTDLVDGLVTVGQGEARVQEMPDGAQEAVARLSGATAKALGFHATGLTARCTTTVDGLVSGLTRLTSGQALDLDLPLIPAVGTRLRLVGGASVILNRQVVDATGGLTVIAVSLTSKAGAVTELGLAHCSAERVIPTQRAAISAMPKKNHDPIDDLLGGVKFSDTDASLIDGTNSVTGGLGAVNAPVTIGAVSAPVTMPVTTVTTSLAERKTQLSSPEGAATSVPGTLSASPDDTLSGLLGGLPGLPGAMPAGVMSALPANPIG
jgi:hypothetical protein